MMLIYKAWRESQVRFLSAAVALAGWCVFLVLFPALRGLSFYNQALGSPYHAYADLMIFGGSGQGLFELLVMFLGLGGLLRERAHHTAVFSLALPVSRAQLLGAQIVVGLVELALLALLPALLIQPLSALVHQSYPIADGFRYGLLRFVGGTVIFAISFFLSAVLRGEYTAVVGCFLALMFDGVGSNWLHPYRTNLMRIMDARWEWSSRAPDLSGPLPWTLLSITMLIGLALFAASIGIAERQNL
jgi:hypothetical protein